MMMPTVIASADESAMKAAGSPAASGATTAIDMIDIVELVVILRWRLVAKSAYAVMPDDGRIQARLRRHPGHLRIGHRHRDHDRADDDARDQVVAQPGALIRSDPADDRDVAPDAFTLEYLV